MPLILDKNGIRVAILALAEEKFSITTKTFAGVAPIHPISNFLVITEIKNDVDCLLIILHAGNEFFLIPDLA